MKLAMEVRPYHSVTTSAQNLHKNCIHKKLLTGKQLINDIGMGKNTKQDDINFIQEKKCTLLQTFHYIATSDSWWNVVIK